MFTDQAESVEINRKSPLSWKNSTLSWSMPMEIVTAMMLFVEHRKSIWQIKPSVSKLLGMAVNVSGSEVPCRYEEFRPFLSGCSEMTGD